MNVYQPHDLSGRADRHPSLMAVMVIIVALIYTLLSAFTPMQFDDHVFAQQYIDCAGGSSVLNPDSLIDYWLLCRESDNGRISNFLSPLSTVVIPFKWLFPLMSGIAAAAMIWLVCRLGAGRSRSVAAFPITWLLLTILLPWRNNILVADYMLNYVWGSAITLLFVYVTLRAARHGWTGRWMGFSLLMAFPAAGWHEGFAIPTAFGLLSILVLKGRWTRRWQPWLLLVIFSVVALLFLICPGMIARFSREVGASGSLPVGRMLLGLVLPIILALACSILSFTVMGREVLRSASKRDGFVIFSAACAAATLIALVTSWTDRMTFYPTICALIALTRLYMAWKRHGIPLPHISQVPLAFSILAICILQSGLTIYWQWRISRENAEVMSLISESESGTVYADVLSKADIPMLTLYMPTANYWHDAFTARIYSQIYGKRAFCVLPTSLKGITSSSGHRLGGDLGARSVGDQVFIPVAEGDTIASAAAIVPVIITLDGGRTVTRSACFLPFESESARRMVYVSIPDPPSGITAINRNR